MKIKDWTELHPGSSTGSVYKTIGLAYEVVDQSFIKTMARDIDAYLLELEMKVKPKPKGPQYKKPNNPKKAAAHARDWGYDEMVDNRITLNA